MALGGILHKEGLIYKSQKTPSKEEFNFELSPYLDRDVPIEVRDWFREKAETLKQYYPNAEIIIGNIPITVREL